jgi:signal transduction histidine kinase
MCTPSRLRLDPRARAVDAALAVALAVVGVLITATAGLWMPAERPPDAAGHVLVVATSLVLAVRRRWPRATLAGATVLTSGYLIAGYPYGMILLSFAVAVYTVARHLPLRWSLPAAAAALPVLLLHLLTDTAALAGFLGLAPGTAWVVVPFAIGATRRLAWESAAQARAEVIRQHVDDERLRVAQDVHDIVGHGLAAIKMQADIALHLLPRKPDQAQTALEAISRTSREALDELRATLAVVRRADAERAPAPTLARIGELRQRMADAGLEVQVRTSGTRRALPAVVDLTCYRIVQESLTNVLRHSEARTATVTVQYADHVVRVLVTNLAPDARRRDGGLGIAGMRQRVEALGGEFSAGATTSGRFEVRASIPTGDHR